MGVTIMAFCFVPVLTHSRATIQETESSQEDILARHFLVDLVERYKAASLDELKRLPPAKPSVTLGDDPIYIRNDGLLSDRARVYTQLQGLASSTGYKDGAISGLKKFVDLASFTKLTRLVWFEPDVSPGGVSRLHCAIRWKPRSGPAEREIEVARMVVRLPPNDSTVMGSP